MCNRFSKHIFVLRCRLNQAVRFEEEERNFRSEVAEAADVNALANGWNTISLRTTTLVIARFAGADGLSASSPLVPSITSRANCVAHIRLVPLPLLARCSCCAVTVSLLRDGKNKPSKCECFWCIHRTMLKEPLFPTRRALPAHMTARKTLLL